MTRRWIGVGAFARCSAGGICCRYADRGVTWWALRVKLWFWMLLAF